MKGPSQATAITIAMGDPKTYNLTLLKNRGGATIGIGTGLNERRGFRIGQSAILGDIDSIHAFLGLHLIRDRRPVARDYNYFNVRQETARASPGR